VFQSTTVVLFGAAILPCLLQGSFAGTMYQIEMALVESSGDRGG
jgi:hypothetical protein